MADQELNNTATQEPLPEYALPVIDVSSYINKDDRQVDEETKQKIAKAVHDACTETGFFLISNYQQILPQEKIDALFLAMRHFFSLPAAAKRQLKGTYGRGYFAFGEENLSTIYPEHNVNFEDKDLGDYKEGLDMGPEVDSSHPYFGEVFYTPNRWPDPEAVGQEWRALVLEYFELASHLGHVLNRIFARSLGLPETWFEERMGSPLPTLRMLHYPPSPQEKTRMGCGAHSDYGCCAILAQDDAGGLELLNKQGQWVAVRPVPRTLVINIGDMMQRWTNDRYRSTLHRVINPSSGRHRFSSPFFFEPGVDCMVECVPTCVAPGEAPRHPPIRFGDHLLRMYTSTFYVNRPTSLATNNSPPPDVQYFID